MSWGETKTIWDRILSAKTEILNALNESKHIIATEGTTVTLKSGSNLSATGTSTATAFTVVAPYDGVYRFDMNYTLINAKNSSGLTSEYATVKIRQKHLSFCSSSNSSSTTLTAVSSSAQSSKLTVGTSSNETEKTESKTLYVYLPKGMAVNFTLTGSYNSINTKINTATCKYVKTLI